MASTPQPNGIPPTTTPAHASPIPTSQPQSQTPQQSQLSQAPAQVSDTTITTPRPHDARTIHLILNSLGLSSYQDRVPLQLLDLAYRYSSSILSDAAHLAAEGYTMPDTTAPSTSTSNSNTAFTSSSVNANTAGGGRNKKASNDGDVTLPALRLATSARLGHGFHKDLPKIAMLGLAEERNRVRLPEVGVAKVFGIRLPEERFMLTGRGWGLGYAEDGDGQDDEEDVVGVKGEGGGVERGAGLHGADGGDGDEDEEMDEDGEGAFEDVFGEGAGRDEMEE